MAEAASIGITVFKGDGGSHFSPLDVQIRAGDTVIWNWANDGAFHSVNSGTPEQGADGLFDSGIQKYPFSFSPTFPKVGHFSYMCRIHKAPKCAQPAVTVAATNSFVLTAHPLNLSTRLRVETGEGAMIAGFIITGNAPKKVIVRAIGPSLAQRGIEGTLANPTLRLIGPCRPIASNDNWREAQQAEIEAAGIAPTDERESAIIATLEPGAYTAVLEGKNRTTGAALVEVYDLNENGISGLANLSTRGAVETELM